MKSAILWLAALVLGCAFLSFFPSSGVNGAGALTWILAALTLMIGYVAASRALGEAWTALADPTYFLGFLWTLWALIDATVIRGSLEPARIFSAFSFALVTTLLGMTGRVILLQAGQSEEPLDPQLKKASDDLTAALRTAIDSVNGLSRAFDGALQDISVSMAGGTAAMQQATNNLHQEVIRLAEQELQGAVKRVIEQLDGFRLPWESVHDQSRQFATSALESFKRLDDTLQQLPERLEARISALESSIRDLELPKDLLRSRVEPLVASLEEEAVRLSQAGADFRTALQAVAEECRSLAQLSATTATAIDRLTASAAAGTDALSTLPAAVARIERGGHDFARAVTADQMMVVERFSGTAADVRREAEELRRAIDEIIAFLRERTVRSR